MNNIKRRINRQAEKVVDELGWERNYFRDTVQALDYPYAVSFSKQRELMNVRILAHPRLENNALNTAHLRFVVHPGTDPKIIARKIKDVLVPKAKLFVTNTKSLW